MHALAVINNWIGTVLYLVDAINVERHGKAWVI